QDHWTNHYNKHPEKIIYNKLREEIKNLDLEEDYPEKRTNPPWETGSNLEVDITLSKQINKSQSQEICKALGLELISRYNDKLHVYTDGSKDERKRVGCSVYIPDLKKSEKYRIT